MKSKEKMLQNSESVFYALVGFSHKTQDKNILKYYRFLSLKKKYSFVENNFGRLNHHIKKNKIK